MQVDKIYCMSSYLMYRTIADHNKCFAKDVIPNFWNPKRELTLVKNSEQLQVALQNQIDKAALKGRLALALSGGIDSAILAKMVPKDTIAYTFKCIVPGVEVLDETPAAARYAKECGLEHRVIEIHWEDFLSYAPLLMKHKGAPIHSIEVQIYKAGLQAKADGANQIVFGESADLNYGGLSNLLSRDYSIGEFINRYSYVLPYYVLSESCIVTSPCTQYIQAGKINLHEFCRGFFLEEAMGSYSNACECANIQLQTPYVYTSLAPPLDFKRIRNGENKYLVREVFHRLYPGWEVPPKTPMPRPMNEWMRDWQGPTREEFWPGCIEGLNGDQRWYVWALERFLNLLEE